MASLKDIRNRIKSVSSTRQITSAMKMVSAAKLRKAQNAITQIYPYANKLQELLSNLSASLDDSQDSKFTSNREVKNVLIVVITSNRGLCGSFNSSVVRRAVLKAETTYADKNVSFFLVGKKAFDMMKARKVNIVSTNTQLMDKASFEQIAAAANELMQQYVEGKYDHIEVIYNHFRNAAIQNLVEEQFLPIKMEQKTKVTVKHDYILEPSKEFIVNELIPKSLKIQFYKTILDSVASEHGARMTAMHKATDSATDMIRDLKLVYNKARQGAITKELLEIVAGAEALHQ